MWLVTAVVLFLGVGWFVDLESFWVSSCFLSYDSFPCMSVVVEEISLVMGLMLLCCGFVALFYGFHYFGYGVLGELLFPLVVLFLGVMALLVVTSDFIYTLVMWEYLGLVSFFLILYYANSVSLRAAVVTLVVSRFGDVAIFVVIMWVFWMFDCSLVPFLVVFLLAVMTKSACYPFVSWLLEAMRAPTPVSSLVHSSTLVAAGVWFLLRYSSYVTGDLLEILLFFCFVTILLTSFAAVVFMDLKKIVALSTCNNVSWCVVFFACGDLTLALFQLLTHGLCKCYLFMSVGDLMGQSGSSQSAVGVYLSRYSGRFSSVIQAFLVLCLCGLPFLGVFFTKHSFLSGVLYSGSLGVWVVSLFCFMMSYVYSVRFALLLLDSERGISLGFSSVFIMICPLVAAGTLYNFIGGMMTEEVLVLGLFMSVVVMLVQLVGISLGYFLYGDLVAKGRWSSLLWGCESYVSSVYGGFKLMSSSCFISFYRWEVYVLDNVMNLSFGKLLGWGDISMFSWNFWILFVVFSLVYFWFLG